MTKTTPAEPCFLHLLAQQDWHGDAYIIGTKAGLEKLRNAITAAIEFGCAVADNVYPNDGEGYWLSVVRASEDQMDDVPLGYISEIASDDTPIPDWVEKASTDAVQTLLALRKSNV